jgi:hypothetical protein
MEQSDDKEIFWSGPRYIAVDNSTKTTHIIASEEIDCSKCSQEWEEIGDNINPEPTESCNGCNGIFHSRQLAVSSKHVRYPEVSLCKMCYKALRFNEETDIETPFEEQDKVITR